MTLADAHTCVQCGHKRWGTDRFCAGCGAAFEGSSATAADLVELRPLDESTPTVREKTGSNQVLVLGLLFLGLVIALGVGLSTLTGGGDTAEGVDDAAIESRSASDDSAVAPTNVPAPDQTLAEDLTADADAHAAEQAARAVDRTARADQLSGVAADGDDENPTPKPTPLPAGFEDLGGYLIVSTAQETIAHPVRGGDPVTLFSARQIAPFEIRFGRTGLAIPPTVDTPEWTFARWDGTASVELDLEPGEGVAFVLSDPDAGDLLVVMDEDQNFQTTEALEVVHVATGDRKSIDLDGGLLLEALQLWYGSNTGTTPSEGLVMSAGNTIYRWTWDSGWRAIGDGTVEIASGAWMITADCVSPDRCERGIRSIESGELVAEITSQATTQPWGSSISPDGRHLSYLQFANNAAPTASVLNIATGQTQALSGPSENIFWVGDDLLLTWSWGRSSVKVRNVTTGDDLTVTLPSTPNGSITWVPALPVINKP